MKCLCVKFGASRSNDEDALADNFCTEMSPEESKAWLDVAMATLHWKRECRCCINIDDEVTRTFMAGVINALRDPALAHRFSEELEPIAFALKQLGWAIGKLIAEAEGDDRDLRRHRQKHQKPRSRVVDLKKKPWSRRQRVGG